MIQVNEFRLGNLIYSPIEKEIVKLVAIEQGNRPITLGKMGTSSFSGFDCLEPIPLTEEILLKCGFKLSHKGFTYDKKRLSICLPCDSYKNGRVYFNSWCISEKSIDSLHQLQNLYFSLTNEELTFNNL